MPDLFIDERKGSGDFDRGAGAGTGKILFYVLYAASPDEALAACEADERAAEVINGYLRGKGSVTDQGGGAVYFVDFDYARGIPGRGSETAGQPPEGGRDTKGDKKKEDPLSRDVSFSSGGASKKIFKSLETRYRVSKDGSDSAPDFKGLIGVDVDGGKVEGCEVLAPTADFTITKRFQQLTVGWFRNMLDLVATTNNAPYLGLDIGEVLHKGCDGQYKDGDQRAPWTVTGRFGYSRNRVYPNDPPIDPDPLQIGDLSIPDVRGWEYVWILYEKKEQTVTIEGKSVKVIVQVPKFAYVERVYPETDFNTLDLE